MSIGIRIKNAIVPSRIRQQCEKNWHDGGGFGLNPKICKKFEGMGEGSQDKIRYEKGYSRMMGTCNKCEFYKGDNAQQGLHCKKKKCVK
jgi:hypothetical protein